MIVTFTTWPSSVSTDFDATSNIRAPSNESSHNCQSCPLAKHSQSRLTTIGHQVYDAFRQRRRLSVAVVVQTMGVPSVVTPVAPCVEQKAPEVTVDAGGAVGGTVGGTVVAAVVGGVVGGVVSLTGAVGAGPLVGGGVEVGTVVTIPAVEGAGLVEVVRSGKPVVGGATAVRTAVDVTGWPIRESGVLAPAA